MKFTQFLFVFASIVLLVLHAELAPTDPSAAASPAPASPAGASPAPANPAGAPEAAPAPDVSAQIAPGPAAPAPGNMPVTGTIAPDTPSGSASVGTVKATVVSKDGKNENMFTQAIDDVKKKWTDLTGAAEDPIRSYITVAFLAALFAF